MLGRSTRGRPIEAVRVGDPSARPRILVIGCIHGDECAGVAATRRLERAEPAADVWIVHHLNPDGYALGRRQNARGVDLNRNFDSEWRRMGRRWSPEYSGPRPFSERESRIARRLITGLQPDVTIWFHQPQALVRAWGPSIDGAREYARLAGDAVPGHPVAGGDRAQLAEPSLPGEACVRRRASGRAAQRAQTRSGTRRRSSD